MRIMRVGLRRLPAFAPGLVVLLVVLHLQAGRAFGFAEDVCQSYLDGGAQSAVNADAFNCNDLQGLDGEGGVLSGMVTYARTIAGSFYARSSLHFESAWIIARLYGMADADALKVAAYSQATDLGTFTPYDSSGAAMEAATTDDIDGVTRLNLDTYGFWLHYVPWYKRAARSGKVKSRLFYRKTPGRPSPFARAERPLNHIRDWALGRRDSLCSFGMTGAGSRCYSGVGPGSATLSLSAPLFGPVRTDEEQVTLGDQIVSPADGAWAAAQAGSLEALGIYLHAMIDRLSHHFCSDKSPIVEDRGSSPRYRLYYDQACGQLLHVTLHYREAGHWPVPPRSKRALRYMSFEIPVWMDETNYPAEAQAGRRKIAVALRKISKALSINDADARIAGLKAVAEHYGLGWIGSDHAGTFQVIGKYQNLVGVRS